MPMVEDATAAEQAMHKQMQADMAQVFRTEFAAADKNSDGKLSFAEYARGMGQEAAMDGELPGDKDKDGQLSLSEYVTLFDVPTDPAAHTVTDDTDGPNTHEEHTKALKVRMQPRESCAEDGCRRRALSFCAQHQCVSALTLNMFMIR